MTGVLRLYPRWWRRRYGDEMRAYPGCEVVVGYPQLSHTLIYTRKDG